MAALAGRRDVEILGRILGGDHTDFEHQILAAGSDAGDAPPLEERPHVDPVELRDPILHDFSGDLFGIVRQVVVRRQRDAALTAQPQRESAGGRVKGVGVDVGGDEADREAVLHQFVVSGGTLRRGAKGGREEREAEDEEKWRGRH